MTVNLSLISQGMGGHDLKKVERTVKTPEGEISYSVFKCTRCGFAATEKGAVDNTNTTCGEWRKKD